VTPPTFPLADNPILRDDPALERGSVAAATARNASREDRRKVKPNGAHSSKLKRYRIGKYAAIGAPILSLICYVYILVQGYAK
jgi:hypothetical protein